MGAPAPTFLPSAFAKNATNPTYINLIPATTGAPGRADFNLGFPPSTMTPKIAGGKPPFGQDMNGILYMLSTWAFYQQAGQLPNYSSAVSTAISGYALGTLLRSVDGATVWFNITDGNTADPDAGGAGWVPIESYGVANVTGVTGGTVTLNVATQAAKSFIVITGTLASNATIILPKHVRSWLIVNGTTGAFTLTVKTDTGTGVAIAQAGFAGPVGVWGDGTNIYPVLAPLSVPSDVAPTPNTYAVRSAAGYLYATFFNMSGAADNLGVTNVIYENSNDGFLRKMTQANFRAQLFASPDFTGVATAPTQAFGDNSTKLATTAFVQAAVGGVSFRGRMTANGVGPTLPTGWTSSKPGTGSYLINYPAPIANPLSVVATVAGSSSTGCRIQSSGVSGFQVVTYTTSSGGATDSAFEFNAGPYTP